LGRGPRPRRGGRRRSFMQLLSVRVNARGPRLGVLASNSMRLLQSRRRGWNGVSRECHTAYAVGGSVDDGNRATRLVLCLDRLPARIPHAGSGDGPTRGRGASSRLVYPQRRGHWVRPRIDARSVDAERCRTDGRNEYGQLRRFAQPTTAGCELRAGDFCASHAAQRSLLDDSSRHPAGRMRRSTEPAAPSHCPTHTARLPPVPYPSSFRA
jgi:hypothetical protein